MFVESISVKLYALPMELWNEDLLKKIGDELNKFINIKGNFHSKVDRKVIKILVDLISKRVYLRNWRLFREN
jgi:hypothetical protein